MRLMLMAAALSAIPPLYGSAADMPIWAAKFAATVSVAKEHCSEHYSVRLKVAAKFLASIHPRVDPDDPEVKAERDLHLARLEKHFVGKSVREVCSRLHEVLGPNSQIVKVNHLSPIMVIRAYVKDE